MVNERSGNPSGENPGKPVPKKASGAPPSAKSSGGVGADGWPSWMGDADASLAPAQPPAASRPKPAAQNPKSAAAKPAAARTAAPAERACALPAAEAVSPSPGSPRRWLRSSICAFAVLLSLIAGELAARSRPDSALRFQEAVRDLRDRIPATIPLPIVATGIALGLGAAAVWQAGRPRRPLFLPVASALCLASAAVGLFRGGHDVDLERNASLIRGRVGSLENELGKLRKKLDSAVADGARAERLRKELEEWQKAATKQLSDKDRATAKAMESFELKLREQTARLQEALADRDKMAGSLQQSSVVHQASLKEKDEALNALRKEIEDLKRKLAEKN